MSAWALICATLISVGQGGVDFKVESETTTIDPAKSVFLRVELRTPPKVTLELPDLRNRVQGFSLAEDFVEEPRTETDGTLVQVANWRLVPEPCAELYRIRPFAVGDQVAGPVYFEPPAAREPVTGAMEANPEKDFPPLSWKLVGYVALAILVAVAVIAGLVFLIRLLARKVREHRMSPIERAWVELDRLLQKGLPGRGRYKDFYVELTMVVRRYIQRKYGVKAPNLTTEEFLREITSEGSQVTGLVTNTEALRKFLESADLVKFAGVEATPEMADAATDSARGYLKGDSTNHESNK